MRMKWRGALDGFVVAAALLAGALLGGMIVGGWLFPPAAAEASGMFVRRLTSEIPGVGAVSEIVDRETGCRYVVVVAASGVAIAQSLDEMSLPKGCSAAERWR